MSLHRSAAILLAVGGLIAASASPALAQDDVLKREALQRFQEGTALMNDGKHDLARAKFVQAYAGARLPNVVFNLARCEHLTGRYLEATRHYREYLRLVDRKKVSATDLEQVEGWLKTSRRFHGQLEITAPVGAYLLVDGERVGDAPLAEPVDVSVGKHSVTAELAGKRLTADASTPAGTVTRVELEEPAAPPSAASAERPGIAGDTEGPAGTHGLVHGTIDAPPTEPPPSSWTGMKTAGIITWAGAAAAGVAGGFFLASASDRAEHGRNVTTGTCSGVTSPECDQAKADARASGELQTAGWAAVGGAAVLAGTGAVLFFWLGKDRSADRAALAIRGTGLEYIQRF